ncbi:MAG: spore protease YyaC [Bacillota bacterium]
MSHAESTGKQVVVQRVPVAHPQVVNRLTRAIRMLAEDMRGQCSPCVVLCIGSDRSTGDALGPLVGSRLQASRLLDERVWGTLDEPVHAINLMDVLSGLRARWKSPFLVAVDASLGSPEHVGTVAVGKGPLRPGAAVNKDLPTVGQMFITGTVNVGGFMEYAVLQSTRLSLVVKMAEIISASLVMASPHLDGAMRSSRSNR